ncbi:MAG TPA: hypothetical protein VLF66_05835 [Thermoanaerobaculia bacterium]|nr:hypothetical protein [Thermoanaerobaculia bacterium]
MAVLFRDGVEVARRPFEYAGTTSQFRTVLPAGEPGLYEVLAYAYHPETGNTGLDRTTFIVRGE